VQNDVVVDRNVDRSLADRAKAGMAKTGEAVTDGWITTKVKWSSVGEDLLDDRDITVDTTNRVVTLKGTITSTAGRNRAVALAKRTSGVQRVVDQLTVVKWCTSTAGWRALTSPPHLQGDLTRRQNDLVRERCPN
jgi:osmotically-inducible protein OsmY